MEPRKKLFILDDDEMMCLFLRQHYKTEYDISFFTSEAACSEALKHTTPDFIVIDYNLENMTGLDFYEANQARLDGTEKIFLSSQSDLTVIFEIINSHVGKYVVKDENMLECLNCLFTGNIEAYEQLL